MIVEMVLVDDDGNTVNVSGGDSDDNYDSGYDSGSKDDEDLDSKGGDE